ncbi:MAG: hypothetical protein ACXVBW_15975 [Bdellovibrionota bacterium]
MKRPRSDRKISTHHELVQVDLEFPRLQSELETLELEQLLQFRNCIEKIQKMTWAQILATSSKSQKRGLNWEPLPDQSTASGGVIATIRVTQKCRARVTREGVFMRFISIHPDHDGAYEEAGGEDLQRPAR